MKKLVVAALAALSLAPAASRADLVIEASAGSGAQVDPRPVTRIPTNVMLAGGYSFSGIVKLELGVLGELADVKESKFDVQLRPMLVVQPPAFPLYLRGIAGVSGLAQDTQRFIYGGALGTSFGLFGAGGFLEVGAIPRTVEVAVPGGGTTNRTFWLAEGRMGVYWD
jgi:hypothetical protein